MIYFPFKACGANLTSSSGAITSPGYPLTDYITHYLNGLSCTWLIEPTNADIIHINFTVFSLYPDGDEVRVYDGISLDSPYKIYDEWYHSLPFQWVSTGNQVMILFTSGESHSSVGFSLTYEGIKGKEVYLQIKLKW